MALQDALLAALSNGESSGYDLAKSFDVTVANFWTATPQQLYRELDRMQSAGLIEARLVEQEKRPNKRMFSLTAAGRGALHDFTARSPRPTAIRDELLVQVDAMELGDGDAVRSHLEDRLAASRQKLERYERDRGFFLAGRSEEVYLAEEKRLGRYLTLARGIAFEQENVRWCELALKVLDNRG
jgi:DNA-binding PadR family transcriptional regulator